MQATNIQRLAPFSIIGTPTAMIASKVVLRAFPARSFDKAGTISWLDDFQCTFIARKTLIAFFETFYNWPLF